VKGEIYEGLLVRNVEDVKGGVGHTLPRYRCFMLAAYDYMAPHATSKK
jgi:hypothetical protein